MAVKAPGIPLRMGGSAGPKAALPIPKIKAASPDQTFDNARQFRSILKTGAQRQMIRSIVRPTPRGPGLRSSAREYK